MRFFLFVTFLSFSVAQQFRVGLANIYFMTALFENNVENPIFSNPATKPSAEAERVADRMNLEYLARYFRYLDADVLVLCEAPAEPKFIEDFVKEYLNDQYEVIHNSSVVKEKKYYFNQQIAALIRKDLFEIRKYEALEDSQVTEKNRRYPFFDSIESKEEGLEGRYYWSRYPVEFDLALKTDFSHWYKFIATYPKSKYANSEKESRKAILQNYFQQKMVRNRLEEVKDQFEDIFILGDMNDNLGLDKYESKTGKNSLQALYQGDNDPLLWDSVRYNPEEGTFIHQGKAGVIDYIFLSHGLKKGIGVVKPKTWEHFHFYKTMVRNTKEPRPDRLDHLELFLSDHAPVTVDVIHDETETAKKIKEISVDYVDEIRRQVGQEVFVTGIIKKVEITKNNKVAFLMFEKSEFQGVIFTSDFDTFAKAGIDIQNFYNGKKVRLRGKINLYKGKVQMILNDPGQILLQ